MKSHPILFQGDMVRALLADTKTQTRRALRVQPPPETKSFCTYHHPDPRVHHWAFDGASLLDFAVPCPYGQVGDWLYVRETWQHENHPDGPYQDGCQVYYRTDYLNDPHGADGEKSPEGRYRTWRPAIHMPRTASRITLEIVSVRIERLQEISEADAKAEGSPDYEEGVDEPPGEDHYEWSYRASYRRLWESINGPGSWDANPFVWVISFRRIKP